MRSCPQPSRWSALALVVTAACVLPVTAAAAATAPPGAGTASVPSPQLVALKKRLDDLAAQKRAGNAQYWYIDAAKGKVHVAVLRGARDAATNSFLTTFAALTDTADVDKPVTPFVAPATAQRPTRARQGTVFGGQRIETASGGFCSTGFNRQHNGAWITTTAGHCHKAARDWYIGGALFGPLTRYVYPGRDYAEITPTSAWFLRTAVREQNGHIQEIASFGDPYVGQPLCKTGARTGTTCGQVTALDVTVNYSDGPVYGLAATTVSAAEGDSGGSVYNGSTGVAMISGGPRGGGNAWVYPTRVIP
ncbi:hypothetical protein GCM10009560_46140 [Nonomuraea longicatena]|uniref:Peptidase S1A alpha-lytic prodomain domain-containing protein n=1 Tax=Nonomuraea longicatena TaxID=83682 RepID=A0ABN1Q373_9ACTN